jgi:hypothetical protein
MSARSTTAIHAIGSGTSPMLLALRAFALLTTLNVLCQGASAGELLMKNHAAFPLHEAGAIVLHVLSALTAIAGFLYWRATRLGLGTTVIAAVVFVVSFIQAAVGHGRTLYIHVPLAMVLLVGAVWVMAWSWLPTARAEQR